MNQDIDRIYNTLCGNAGAIAASVSDLAPVERSRGGEVVIELKCPACGGEDAWVCASFYKEPVIRHHGNCPLASTPLPLADYIIERDGEGYGGAVKVFTESLGLEYVPISKDDEGEYLKNRSVRDLLIRLDNVFRAKLFCPDGAAALANLRSVKGYLEEEVMQRAIGYFPGYRKMDQELEGQGYALQTIQRVSKWVHEQPYGDYNLTRLQRDNAGMPVAIWGCSLISGAKEEKFLSFGENMELFPMTGSEFFDIK